MKYFIFQICMAVRFSLQDCGLWHRVVLLRHTNISKDYSASIFRYKINAVMAWLVYTDTLQGLWSLRSAGERGKKGSAGRGIPVGASSRCEQKIWKKQGAKLTFTPTISALKMEAEYLFEPLAYTRSALWMLHCPVELYCDPLCAFMASYRTNCIFTFTTVLFPQVTVLYAAPPLVLFLASHPGVLPKYLQSLRHVFCGAAPLGSLDAERFLKRAPPNTDIVQGSMWPLLYLTNIQRHVQQWR